MSPRDETTALVKRYYDAFNAGDDETMLSLLSENVVHDINQGGRETGKEAFRLFLIKMGHTYRERLEDIVVMASDDGTRAAAEFVVHGEYRQGEEGLPPARGQRYVLPAGAFFEVLYGAISRVSVHYNLSDWISQVSAAHSAEA